MSRISARHESAYFRLAVTTATLLLAAASSAYADVEAVMSSAAVGRSNTATVEQHQKDLIDQYVFGASIAVPGVAVGGGLPGANQLGGPRMNATGGGAAAEIAAGGIPTGRLRTTDHAGLYGNLVQPSGNAELNNEVGATGRMLSFKTQEASIIATGVVPVQGTVAGGQVKLSGFLAYDWLSLEVKSNAHILLDPNQYGRAENETFFVGGSVLWAANGMYALASVVGSAGKTQLVDSIDDCTNDGCRPHRFDTYTNAGIISTLTAGKVFQLTDSATGPMLDVRGSINYTRNTDNGFFNPQGQYYKINYATWTGTASSTVFANLPTQNGGILRPYLQAFARHDWGNENPALLRLPDGDQKVTRYEQSPIRGGVDVGVSYNLDKMTLGAAVYTEVSDVERTFGGRFGASWMFGGDEQKRPAQSPPIAAFSWAGFYFGASAGHGWADVDMTNLGDSIFAPVDGSDRIVSRGYLGGGQAGYNWQLGGIVAGVEGGAMMTAVKGERLGSFNAVLDFPGDHWRAEITQLYAITARFGADAGDWLPYVKGGFATARVETSMSRPGEPNFVSDAKSWRPGWTVGTGVEYAVLSNMTVGVEYDFYKFEGNVEQAVRTGTPPTGGVADTWSAKVDNLQTVTARANFRLN